MTFSINLNVQHVNGMTPFDLAVHMYVRLLDKSSSHSTMLCSAIFSGVLLGVYGFKGRGKEIPGTQSSFCESVSILFAPLCDAFLKEWQNFFWLLQT